MRAVNEFDIGCLHDEWFTIRCDIEANDQEVAEEGLDVLTDAASIRKISCSFVKRLALLDNDDGQYRVSAL